MSGKKFFLNPLALAVTVAMTALPLVGSATVLPDMPEMNVSLPHAPDFSDNSQFTVKNQPTAFWGYQLIDISDFSDESNNSSTGLALINTLAECSSSSAEIKL